MFESVPSLSYDMPCADVIERLISSGQVEGIALFGSAQLSPPHGTSDYDLLILTANPAFLFSKCIHGLTGSWSAGSSAIYLQSPSKHPTDVNEGLRFWNTLLQISQH